MLSQILTLTKVKLKPGQSLILLGLLLMLICLTLLLPPAATGVLAGFIPVAILIRLTLSRFVAYGLVSATTLLAALKVASIWLLPDKSTLELKLTGTLNLIILVGINWLILGLVDRLVSKLTWTQKWAWQQQEQLKMSLLDFEEKHVLGQSAGQDISAVTTELKKAVGRQLKLHQQHLAASQQVTSALQELTHTASNIASSAQNIYRAAEEALSFTRQVQLTTTEVAEGSKRGLVSVEQTVESNHRVALLYKELVEVLNQLHHQSGNISEVVSLIHSLSSEAQTLAFNAALEATGVVGVEGERFRVVATEFRTLAVRSVKASQVIDQILGQLEIGIGQAVAVARTGQAETETAVACAQENGKVLSELALNIARNTAQMQQVEQLVIDTTNLTKEISLATLQQHSACTQAVQTLEAVNELVEQNSRESRHLNQTVHHLEKFSRALLELLASNGPK